VRKKCFSSVTYSDTIAVGNLDEQAGDIEAQENIFDNTVCEAKSKFRDCYYREHDNSPTTVTFARP
jgi:hypothetical protein